MALTPATHIPVVLPGHSYRVAVGVGAAGELPLTLKSLLPATRQVVLVVDSRIAPLHGRMLERVFTAAGLRVLFHEAPASEEAKRLGTLLPLMDAVLAEGIDRKTVVVAVGGGVTLDMAGFMAAMLLRGLPLVQVPTTLLAMVDASVGGKTGVNAEAGKNLIGAFHQPVHVVADVDLLRTLPQAQMAEGLAECIKHAALADWSRLGWLRENLRAIKGFHLETLVELVAWNVTIKAAVVQADPTEQGVRAHLNLGHTFAHAIESVSGHGYSHGQAVGLGLTAAMYLSHRLGGLDDGQMRQVIDLVHESGLPTGGLGHDVGALMAAMQHDKKTEAGRLRLVVLRHPAGPAVRSDVPGELVVEAWKSIGAS
jgi:3-dehydroquinate synthase